MFPVLTGIFDYELNFRVFITISTYLKFFENACTEIEKFENTRHLISKRKYESIACNSLLHGLESECQKFLGEEAILMLKIPDSDRERGRFLKQALSYFSLCSLINF